MPIDGPSARVVCRRVDAVGILFRKMPIELREGLAPRSDSVIEQANVTGVIDTKGRIWHCDQEGTWQAGGAVILPGRREQQDETWEGKVEQEAAAEAAVKAEQGTAASAGAVNTGFNREQLDKIREAARAIRIAASAARACVENVGAAGGAAGGAADVSSAHVIAQAAKADAGAAVKTERGKSPPPSRKRGRE